MNKKMSDRVISAIQGMVEPIAVKYPANGNWRCVVMTFDEGSSVDLSGVDTLEDKISLHLVDIDFGMFHEDYYSSYDAPCGPHAMLSDNESKDVEGFFVDFIDNLFKDAPNPPGRIGKPEWNRVIPKSYIIATLPPSKTEESDSEILSRYSDVKKTLVSDMKDMIKSFSVTPSNETTESGFGILASTKKKDPYGLN